MNRFISDHKDNWQRLEDLLMILETSSIKGLSKMEVREFGELYRRAATDLAIARSETRDLKLINYLNSLVIRAHGKIYRAEGQGANLVWNFFAEDFPRIFRKSWRFMVFAFAVDIIFMIAGFALAYNDLNFADVMGLTDIRTAVETKDYWWLAINDANQIEAAGLFTHNIRVGFYAFTLGAFFCIGSVFILALNGLHFGSVLGICYKIDPAFGNELVTFVVGHGVIELSLIDIAGGAGMMIGYAIINPGNLTRVAALKQKGIEATKIVLGCSCFLVIAGIIEGFLSPSDLPPFVKFGTGVITGVAMYSYLLLAGQENKSNKRAADS